MKRLFFYMICMLCMTILKAQHYPYKQYTTEQGLSQIQVTHLYKDVKGFLWVGTKNGLNRFNGKEFRVFGADQGLLSKQTLNICGDANGRVFANTALDLGYIEQNQYHKIILPNLKSILHGGVLHCDRKNRLWIFNGHQLYRYAVETKQLDSIRFSQKDYPVITPIHEERNHLYFVCEGMLYKVQTDRMTTSELLQVDSLTNYLYPLPGQRKILLGTHNSIQEYYIQTNTFRQIYHNPKIYFEHMFVDNQGRIIIKPSLQPLTCIDGATAYFPSQITSVNVTLVDTVDKLIFAGTEKGLLQIFQNGLIEYDPKSSAMHEEIWNMYEDKNKALWFHSYQYGVTKLQYGLLSDITNSIPADCRRFVYFQSVPYKDKVFVNYGKGVAVNDGQHIRLCRPDISYLAMCSVYDSISGHILIGSHNALLSLNPETFALKTEFNDPQLKRPILSICPLRNQRFLLTSGNGYYLYSLKTHTAERHFIDEIKSPFRGAVATLRDQQGHVWIGSNDGLFLFDERTDSMKHIAAIEKKVITSLIELDTHRLLIGMETKLMVFDKRAYFEGKNNGAYTFDFENGYLGIETGQNGFFKDSKGHIWIPTANKVICLRPEYLFIDTQVKQTLINNLQVGSEIDQWIPQSLLGTLHFDYPIRNIKIEFQPASLINANKIKYQYRLKPDAPWSDWTSQTSVSFYQLQPGEYTFQLRSNHQGRISNSTTSLQFTLLPRWFELLPVQAVLSIGAVLFLFSIGLLIHVRQKNMAMRFQEEKNALELDILKQQLNPHFLRNTLKSFQYKILEMSEENKFEVADNVSELSRLFSLYLEASVKKSITIDDEIRLLSYYLDFQIMRFKDRFSYSITKDPALSGNTKLIPMIIQPFVENASEKAFVNLPYKGHILISFLDQDEHTFLVEVKDNGIGREHAGRLNQNHISHSTEIIRKIHALHNNQSGHKGGANVTFEHQITDLYHDNGEPAGTLVRLLFPKKNTSPA